jgi:hypothetical protein
VLAQRGVAHFRVAAVESWGDISHHVQARAKVAQPDVFSNTES